MSAELLTLVMFGGLLVGEPDVAVVDRSAAPVGGRSVALWQWPVSAD